MTKEDEDLMAYVDGEVRAVCEAMGWAHQIRRKWQVRETPVASSTLEDYEWKLLPAVRGRLQHVQPSDWAGTYYVLSVRRAESGPSFILQHDTTHAGVSGPHFERETATTITQVPFVRGPRCGDTGWLRDHLVALVNKFQPNYFCQT